MKKDYTAPRLTVHGSIEKITLAGGPGGKPCAGNDVAGKAGFSACVISS